MRRYLHRQTWKQGCTKRSQQIRDLDPILVAGRLKGEKIKDLFRDNRMDTTLEWTSILLSIFTIGIMSTLMMETWSFRKENPGWKPAVDEMPPCYINKDFFPNIEKLWKPFKVLRKSTKKKSGRGFMGYFQVEKSESGVDRAIMDGKLLNARMFPDPPKLALIEPEEIKKIVSLFSHPFFAVFDIRHWFWQIELPEEDRHLFSLQVGDTLYESCCLPMGWRFSPWIAQGLALLIAGWGQQYSFRDPGKWTKSPPPYILVYDKDQLVAAVVIYYDNFLVVANSQNVREALCAKMFRNFNAMNVRLKPRKGVTEDLNKKGTKEDFMTFTEGIVEYLGVVYEVDEATLTWRHADSTLERWEKTGNLSDRVTPTDIAHVVCRAVWDLTVRGDTMKEIRRELQILGNTTRGIVAKADWRKEIKVKTEDIDCINALARALREKKNENKRWNRPRCSGEVKRYIVSASDASDHGFGAGFIGIYEGNQWRDLDPLMEPVKDAWNERDRKEHINIRELLAALELNSQLQGIKDPEMGHIHLIDNTSALTWLEKGFCPKDDLQEKIDEWTRRKSDLHSIQILRVPTHLQPMDALSRGEEIFDRAQPSIQGCKEYVERWIGTFEATSYSVNRKRKRLAMEEGLAGLVGHKL